MELMVRKVSFGCLNIFIWKGKTYCTNLFKLMDQEGFSLTDSLLECKKRNWIPCVQQFIADALRAGWTREKATDVLTIAYRDSNG